MFSSKTLNKTLFLSFVFFNTCFANTKIYTFETLLQKALNNSYELKRNENSRFGLIEDIKYENMGFLPRVDFNYDVSKLYKGANKDDNAYELKQNSISINLRHTLYDYEARFTKLKILLEEFKLKQLEKCDVKQKASLRFLDLYVEIYKAKYSLDTYLKLSSLYKNSITLKKKLYEQGLISTLDVLLDENKYLKLKSDISQLDVKLDYLIAVLFNTSGVLLNEKDSLKAIVTKAKFDLHSFQKNNLALKIKDKKDSKIKKEIDYIRKKSLPTFDVYFNNTFYDNNYDENENDGSARDYKMGLEVRWSLNSIFDYDYKKSKKLLELKENNYIYKQEEERLIRDFTNKNLSINNFEKYKKNKEKLIYLLSKEKESKQKLYEQGLEYKYKVLEVQERLIMEKYQLKLKEIENEKNKKYLSIIALKDNSCTPL